MNEDADDDNVNKDCNGDALTRARWARAAGFGFELQAAIALKAAHYLSFIFLSKDNGCTKNYLHQPAPC